MANVLFKHQLYEWADRTGTSMFYNLSEYYTISFAWVGYENSGIPTNQFPQLRLWLLNHVTEEVIIDVGDKGGIGSNYKLYFSKEEDLIFFKLSHWGELVNTA